MSMGAGNAIKSARGQITLDSADSSTRLIVTGLDFEPNALIVWSHPTENTRTVGGFKFAGMYDMWIRINSDGQMSEKNFKYDNSNPPDTLFDLNGVPNPNPNSAYIVCTSDGFRVNPALSNYPFQAGIPYYWIAWRFE